MRRGASELWQWDAVDLAQAIRRRTVSSRDAVQSCLDRLAAVNPKLNAVIAAFPEQALAQARAADAAVARRDELGALHGVPVTIKDNIDQAGVANSGGVAANATLIAAEDSPVVRNWRNAGAVIVGRTNTPAFSARWDTDNALYGRTRNPWSKARTPGGSSGGAAAALAAGIGALAHGNDIGGSIRYPAYCCGVAGIRPTMGRVPSYNASATAPRAITSQLMAVNGPLARGVRDLRLGLATLSPGDPRDPLWVPAPLGGPTPARPIKVALVAAAPGQYVHPQVAQAIRTAGAALSDAGYAVEEAAPPSIEDAARLWLSLILADTRHLAWDAMRKFGDAGVIRSHELLFPLVPDLTLVEYQQALGRVNGHRREWSLFFERYPLVVGPNSGDLPFAIGFDVQDAATSRHVLAAQALMGAVNMLGLPAVAVPVGTIAAPDAPQGLPTGVQIIAGRFREDLALDAAEAIEVRCGLAAPIDPVW